MSRSPSSRQDPSRRGYRPTIGLEVHVQLATGGKLFCRCRYAYGAPPNRHTCPVCLGYPGTLPVLDPGAVRLAARLALALGAAVQPVSAFARKSYFYPDLPKGYQVTQLERPLARGGSLPLSRHGHAVALRRVHLEEDAGKLVHSDDAADPHCRVDFNRAGVPLVEVVTEPVLESPEEAEDFLRSLHRLLLYTGTSEGNLEEGSLRCDANVSLAPADGAGAGAPLGTRVEVKNLNSFRNVARALRAEMQRQAALLDGGGRVVAETRGFDAARGTTYGQRGKEESPDYRYLPEPDLPPLGLSPALLAELRQTLPEAPDERQERVARRFGLDRPEAAALTATPALADYLEAAAASADAASEAGPPGGAADHAASAALTVAHLVRTEVLRELQARGTDPVAAPPAEELGRLAARVAEGTLSHTAAKQVLDEMWQSGEPVDSIVARLDLAQVRDPDRLSRWVGAVLSGHPDLVQRYHQGEDRLLGFLVGRVMQRSGGKADPRRVRAELVRSLPSPDPDGTGRASAPDASAPDAAAPGDRHR